LNYFAVSAAGFTGMNFFVSTIVDVVEAGEMYRRKTGISEATQCCSP
jgi:hypothetical protein